MTLAEKIKRKFGRYLLAFPLPIDILLEPKFAKHDNISAIVSSADA
jgi:hypothetical protein